MGIQRNPRLRYSAGMSAPAQDPLHHHLLRWGVLLFAGAAHGAHDMLEGDRLLPALLPTVGFAIQVALLSFGQRQAERRHWSRALAIVATALASLVGGIITVLLHERGGYDWAGLLGGGAAAGAGVLALWLLVFYFPAQLGRARTRALAAENEQRKAELARLRANLQPHFLLNTLNAVAGLLGTQPQQARQLIVALGELLRDSLEDGPQAHSLADEVEWLRRYAQIFEIRHAGAIRFEWELAPDSLHLRLPRLLLQPLLENAIQHGALRREGGGKVTVRSRLVDGAVQVMIGDDGPGMPSDRPEGLGLRLVADRLRLAHPAATLAIDSSSAGTRLTVQIPAELPA
jgi:hypothetical protein